MHNQERMERTLFHCYSRDIRYSPPLLKLVYYAESDRDGMEWLEKNGGGLYRNTLHNFEFTVKPSDKK